MLLKFGDPFAKPCCFRKARQTTAFRCSCLMFLPTTMHEEPRMLAFFRNTADALCCPRVCPKCPEIRRFKRSPESIVPMPDTWECLASDKTSDNRGSLSVTRILSCRFRKAQSRFLNIDNGGCRTNKILQLL